MIDELMTAERQSLQTNDGHRVLIDLWLVPEAEALVHVLHGLAEHPARYERFARHCNSRKIAVAAHGHRGHGENCPTNNLGHFADENGWNKVITDAALVQRHLRNQLPDTPIVLLGHSMGSYIAQSFMMRGEGSASALILSASSFNSRLQLRLGHWLAAIESIRSGKKGKSAILGKLGFGAFNKAFSPNRTAFDWLSRDPDEVDKYVADPLCGAESSNRLWFDLTGGLLEVSSSKALQKIRSDLPILVTGGADDPASGQKGLTRLSQKYIGSGHKQTTLKIYPQGRHEMLNEINRDRFSEDLTQWMSSAVVTQTV